MTATALPAPLRPRGISTARRAADLRDALGPPVGGWLARSGVTGMYLLPPRERGQPGEPLATVAALAVPVFHDLIGDVQR